MERIELSPGTKLVVRLMVAMLTILLWRFDVYGQTHDYAVTDLGTLGGKSSEARAINARGQIVGQSETASGAFHAFLYSDGVMTDLGTLGGDQSFALGINARGQVVGQSLTSTGATHAFLYSDGVMSDLGTLGGLESAAFGINDPGQVVGVAVTSGIPRSHAFLYSDGLMTDLGTLSTQLNANSIAVAINNAGEVVGETATGASGSEVHAFLYSNGTMKDLGTLGGAPSRAFGINARGQVVGLSDLANGGPHAFLFSDGMMTDLGTLVGNATTTVSVAFGLNDAGQVVGFSQPAGLSPPNHAVIWQDGNIIDVNPPGWQTLGYAINNRGQIVGSGSNPAGQAHGFLLTPFMDAAQ